MKFSHKNTAMLVASMALISTPAFAHVGVGYEQGLPHGIEHFFSGLDHIAYAALAGIMTALATKKLWSNLVALSAFAVVFAMIHEVTLFGDDGFNSFSLGMMLGEMAIMMVGMGITRIFTNARKSIRGISNGK